VVWLARLLHTGCASMLPLAALPAGWLILATPPGRVLPCSTVNADSASGRLRGLLGHHHRDPLCRPCPTRTGQLVARARNALRHLRSSELHHHGYLTGKPQRMAVFDASWTDQTRPPQRRKPCA
jgi:hypothetical protein